MLQASIIRSTYLIGQLYLQALCPLSSTGSLSLGMFYVHLFSVAWLKSLVPSARLPIHHVAVESPSTLFGLPTIPYWLFALVFFSCLIVLYLPPFQINQLGVCCCWLPNWAAFRLQMKDWWWGLVNHLEEWHQAKRVTWASMGGVQPNDVDRFSGCRDSFLLTRLFEQLQWDM